MGDELIGRSIADGRYDIIEKLGEGAMGEVYRARQVTVGRMVALKLIHVDTGRGFEAVARFQREMKLTAKLEHPHTVRVYDFGSWQGQLYLAMELLRGETLRAELAKAGHFPLERTVHIARQILRALAAAHSEGIVHRDLKPENVMLIEQYGERDVVKVLDFGIAKSFDEEDQAKMTGQGAIIGTPAYMSPEQAMGQHVEARSDLYTTGVMLFEMVSGRVPFDASSLTALLVAHATQAPPRLADIAPSVHPGLAQLVSDLLQKDPALRPKSAQEVDARLAELIEKKTGSTSLEPTTDQPAAPDPANPSQAQATSRGLLFVMVLSLFAGIAAAGVLGVGFLRGRERIAPPEVALPPDYVAPPQKLWEVAAVLGAIDNRLKELGLPLPPDACRGDAGPGATLALVSARDAQERDPAAAVNFARKAVAECPEWAAAYNVLGNTLQSSDRLDEAAAAYQEALKLVPDYDAPRFNLGLVQLRHKDPAAIATFSLLIKQKPSYPDVFKSRAQAYLFAKRYREGLADLERSLQKDAEDGTSWLMTGQLREQLKRPGAQEAYCKALDLKVETADQHCKR